jgi:cyclomaltodextrinase
MLRRCTLLLALAILPRPVPAAADVRDVPAWAKDAVWYQIFPERFRNGDQRNDPTVDDIAGAWPHETPKSWHVSSWTGDWYRLQPWEESSRFYYSAQQRRYGGDLQGVIDKLDYLADLGVTALYFNPLFQAPSLHKYDATLYHHIDRCFGPDPAGDKRIVATENPVDPATWRWTSADTLFLRLLRLAHARGMHVIIDGVFNHVGTTFWAFRDARANGLRSAYRDWFTIISWDDPTTPQDEFDYKGWAGVKDLPEFRRDSAGLAPGPRDHIKAIVKRWMDPNGDGDPSDGIDGWRLDVAEMVPIPFWREFRTWVRGINPQAYITGEVWWEDWRQEKMFNAEPWLRGDVFDAVMNYRWARETCRFFKDRSEKISASTFDQRLRALREDYRPDATAVLMNLLDSHDTDRLGSMIVNPDTHYDHNVNLSDNPSYDVRKPNARERATQRLMVLYHMTTLGAPMVYYGDEAGMWGGDDPDERKPMLWPDMAYANEASHPFGKQRPDDVNAFDHDLFAHYKTMIALRKTHPALLHGTYTTVMTDDVRDLFAFLRSDGNEHILIVINNSPAAQTVVLPPRMVPAGYQWKSLLPSGSIDVGPTGLVVSLEPTSGVVAEGTR